MQSARNLPALCRHLLGGARVVFARCCGAGAVQIFLAAKGNILDVCGEGQYFGEVAIINSQRRGASAGRGSSKPKKPHRKRGVRICRAP